MPVKYNKTLYNRERQKVVYAKFKELRVQALNRLGNECYLCSKQAVKGFHLHHVVYVLESNYARHSKAMNVRIKRVKEALSNPERFKLLCPRCHRLVEGIKGYSRYINWDRLKELLA